MARSAPAVSESPATGPRRRVGLEPDDVVDAALALVEAEGAAGLTMRRLATQMGITTTTIYWHVGSRDELVRAVIKRMSERLAQRPVTGDTPAERILSAATNIFRSALAHPQVTALAYQAGAVSLLELPLEVALVRELEAAGVRGAAARDALRAVQLCTAGFLVVALRSGAPAPAGLRPAALWAEADTSGISSQTLTQVGRPPDIHRLFASTMRSVVAGFLPSAAKEAR